MTDDLSGDHVPVTEPMMQPTSIGLSFDTTAIDVIGTLLFFTSDTAKHATPHDPFVQVMTSPREDLPRWAADFARGLTHSRTPAPPRCRRAERTPLVTGEWLSRPHARDPEPGR
jgi:hypothetical protein